MGKRELITGAPGTENNTVIFFSSDNGPHLEGGADPDFFNSNGPFRGYKRDLYEGGIRVPFVAYWPGKVKPGKSAHISAFRDFLPTCCDLAGIRIPAGTDGISFLHSVLHTSGHQKEHEYLYWEFHEKGMSQAVRTGNWKGVKSSNNREIELYDLKNDPGETQNIAGTNIDVVKKIRERLEKCRTESVIWPSPEK